MHKYLFNYGLTFDKLRPVAFSRDFRISVPPNNKTPYRANMGQIGAYIQHYVRFLCSPWGKAEKGIKKDGG